MSLNRTLQSLKIASLFGGVLGLGFGCVVTLQPLEPCESGSNNKLDENGECECRIGYEWCDPTDDTNLDCCETNNGSGGTTGPGDGDGDNSTTNGDGDGSPGDGDGMPGDGDGDGDCAGAQLPPETCSPDEEGFYWCTNDMAMGPECSQFFICMGGVWTESAAFMDESCVFDGYDFAYGCFDDGTNVVFECGDGSGEPCADSDPAFCVDMDQIGYCKYGKTTYDSCLTFCQTEGIEGQTYEYGECDMSIPDDIACFCCDQGDPGCPL
jgi:hypothetical protein